MPELRQQVLAILLQAPEKSWYLRELAAQVEATPSSLHRELQNLVKAGLLRRTESGNRTYFQADTSSPIFGEMQSLIRKTVGAVDIIRQALEPLRSRIDIAFIYGSYAGPAPLRNDSDIDLMVVGDVNGIELSEVLSHAESRLARAINTTLYGNDEFAEKYSKGNHFLLSVLSSETLPIFGGVDGVAKATKRWESTGAPDQQPRVARFAVGR